ncbi:MAG: hypothetical protein ACYTG7_08925 [Planctomycetota bacterium]|jgi:hypothetical protein
MAGKQLIIIMALHSALLLAGCITIELKPIPHEGEFVLTPQNEMDYYDALKDKPRASMADAARLVVPLLGESPMHKTTDELQRILLEHGVIEEGWEISEAAPLTKGKIAFMVCLSTKIHTSLIMKVAPPTERYAMREAVYHELMTHSSPYRYVPGSELMDILADTQAFIKRREAKRSS